MANTINQYAQRHKWMLPNYQDQLFRTLVAKGVGKVEITDADTIHNPYGSIPSVTDGAATSVQSYTPTAFTITDDTLRVNRRALASEYFDPMETRQSSYNMVSERGRMYGEYVASVVDQFMFNLPVSMSGVEDIDDGNFAGTPGNPYALTTSNPDDVAATITEKLNFNNAPLSKGLFWVVSPTDITKISLFQQVNGFNYADVALANGHVKGIAPLGGLEIFVSNNLTHSGVITMGTVPSDGQIVTFFLPEGSVVFTFKTTPAAAGDVLIGANVAAARANLTSAINATGTPGTDYIELSNQDRAILSKVAQMSAVHSTTITITTKSSFRMTTNVGSATIGTIGHHTIAGVKGSMHLAMLSAATYVEKDVPGKTATEALLTQVYNGTIWNNQKKTIFDVYLSS